MVVKNNPPACAETSPFRARPRPGEEGMVLGVYCYGLRCAYLFLSITTVSVYPGVPEQSKPKRPYPDRIRQLSQSARVAAVSADATPFRCKEASNAEICRCLQCRYLSERHTLPGVAWTNADS